MMITALRQTDIAYDPPWKQAGVAVAVPAVAATSANPGAGANGSAAASSQQNALAQGKLSVAYTELAQLQESANSALLGGNPARAMEAAMEASQIASSIRALIGSAPSVAVGSIQLATDQLAALQHGGQGPTGGATGSAAGNLGDTAAGGAGTDAGATGTASLLPWQTQGTTYGSAGGPTSPMLSQGGTSLAEALNEAMAAIASVHLDTRA